MILTEKLKNKITKYFESITDEDFNIILNKYNPEKSILGKGIFEQIREKVKNV